MKRYLFLFLAFASIAAHGQGLSYSDRAQQYIREHKDWAVAEQQRCGIPAAITLAQGIHETDAGASELATMANNHFGIKCKKEWAGETFAHDDDAPQECFRKYHSALESYKDHSDYLKTSKRYQSCFALTATDYAGWARELRKCGYATNPTYAQKLIKIIEDYQLQDFTLAAMNPANKPGTLIASAASPTAAAMMAEEKHTPGEVVPDRDTPAEDHEYGKVVRKDGLKGFWAHKGDVLLEYAIQFKVRYAKLLEINGLPDAPLANDQFIYLERGGTMERMVAKDVSTPTPAVIASKDVNAATTAPVVATTSDVANTNAPAATSDGTVANAPAVTATTNPASVGAPGDVTTTATAPITSSPPATEVNSAPATTTASTTPVAPVTTTTASPVPAAHTGEISAADAAAAAEARIFGNIPPATTPVTSGTSKPLATEAQATAEKPYNIAREKAVEEQKPAEPQDEFSRLKARLDRVVYAPPTKPAPAPAANAPVPTQKLITAAAGPAYHVVKKGETAFGISKQYGLTMQQLMDMNKLSFGTSIKVGQKLQVKQ